MQQHPSLTAQFILPPLLEPRRTMDPYTLCWCQSGKKWKWCHKDRERKKAIPIGALMSQQRTELQMGYCSHPSASAEICSNVIARAHTVQRNGGLSEIQENGHVMSAKAGAEKIFENDGNILPISVGVRSATTFNGFCQKHDSETFRPVEVENRSLSEENVFLLSFRAIAYELYTKRASLKCVPIQRELDCGLPFEIQAEIQQQLNIYTNGLHRGLADLDKWKADYDEALLSKDYRNFSFYAVAFDRILPVVASGGFHPEVDFNGNQLQIISRGNAKFDHITLNLAPLDSVTVAVFGWTATGADAARQFVKSFSEIPDDHKANAVVQLAFEHLENTCFRPSWWYGLTLEARELALKKIKSGIGDPSADRSARSLYNFDQEFVFGRVKEILASGAASAL